MKIFANLKKDFWNYRWISRENVNSPIKPEYTWEEWQKNLTALCVHTADLPASSLTWLTCVHNFYIHTAACRETETHLSSPPPSFSRKSLRWNWTNYALWSNCGIIFGQRRCFGHFIMGQPVAWRLSYLTWTRKVVGSIPGVAMIRTAQLLGPKARPLTPHCSRGYVSCLV